MADTLPPEVPPLSREVLAAEVRLRLEEAIDLIDLNRCMLTVHLHLIETLRMLARCRD
jgi:hypothetical protein